MLSQLVEREAASVWLQNDSSVSWNDELSVVVAKDSGLLDKVNDDKLARDVEDLSAIFEELEGGVVDFPLPCDEDDVATGAEVTGDWIGDLDKDAVNVDELSSMFDVLVAEQAGAFDAETTTSEKEDESMDCSDDDDGDYDDDDDEPQTISVQMIPTPPAWVVMAPLDPRSVIKTPVFQNLDSRIPRVEIPRMDLGFGGASFALKRATGVPAATRPTLPVSPKPCESKKVVAPAATMEYRHDASTCWICKSDKSAYKKFALHRYLEKRHRRNWKRGPRYSGRSNVATSRVREGGRFVTTAHWV